MGSVVRAVVQPFLAAHGGNGLVDEVIVLDDGSSDDTAEQARDAGAGVVAGPGRGRRQGPGHGRGAGRLQRRRRRLPRRRRGQHDPGLRHRAARAAADHRPRRPGQGLLHPARCTATPPAAAGSPSWWPARCSSCSSPSSPGCASRWPARRRPTAGSSRSSASPAGYGVELGLLIDVAQSLGPDRLAQVDLGRAHPPQPAPARAAAPGRRRAAGRARAGRAVLAAAAVVSGAREPDRRRLQPRARSPSAPGATAPWCPVPAGGGLASSLHRLLAGSGTTWASVTMGAADREAVAQGLMHEDGLDLVPVVVDDDTYRQAYDVVANTTLWYCHHHLFDLPHRPRFDRHWRAAWEGYRAYNRAVADVVVARAGEGDAVLVQDYHFSLLGRMLAEQRPDLRSVHFLHTPFAAPAMLGVLPDDVAAELLDGMAGYGACGFHCHQWEAGFRGLLRRGRAGRRRRRSWPRSAPTPACSRRRRRRPRARRRPRRCAPRWAGAASSPGPTAWSRRRTSCAGCWPSRSCSSTHPEWRGQVVHVAFAYPSRQGLAEYLAYGADVVHTAERINHAFGAGGADGWTPILLVRRGRPGPLARRARRCPTSCWSTRCATGSTWWPRRARCSTRPTACSCSRTRRGPGRSWRWRATGALGRQPLRRVGDGRRAPCRARPWGRPSGRGGRPRCGRPCAGARRPTGGRTSWRRPASERLRTGAAPPPRWRRRPAPRSSSTAPVAPCTVRSARAATSGGLSASTAATRTAASGRPSGAVSSPTAAKAGRSPMSSPNTATARSCPACSAASARTTVPLSTVERRAQLALGAGPRAPSRPRCGVLALGEGEDPVPVLGSAAPVQRHRQALGLDVDARGRRRPSPRPRPRR